MSTQSDAPRETGIAPFVRAIVFVALVGAAIALALYGARFPRWSDLIAIVVALMCGAGAARLLAESFDPAALGKRMGVEGAGAAKEAGQVRLQAMLMAVLGLTLAWPPLATLAGYPAPTWSYAAPRSWRSGSPTPITCFSVATSFCVSACATALGQRLFHRAAWVIGVRRRRTPWAHPADHRLGRAER